MGTIFLASEFNELLKFITRPEGLGIFAGGIVVVILLVWVILRIIGQQAQTAQLNQRTIEAVTSISTQLIANDRTQDETVNELVRHNTASNNKLGDKIGELSVNLQGFERDRTTERESMQAWFESMMTRTNEALQKFGETFANALTSNQLEHDKQVNHRVEGLKEMIGRTGDNHQQALEQVEARLNERLDRIEQTISGLTALVRQVLHEQPTKEVPTIQKEDIHGTTNQ